MTYDEMIGAALKTETREDVLDSIDCCREYLEDAADFKADPSAFGPWAHAFDAKSVAFAEEQLAFELDVLARIDA